MSTYQLIKRDMPHQLNGPCQFCFAQSVIEAHPGSLWLYVWLPGDFRVDAFRVVGPDIAVMPSPVGPRVYKWNGDFQKPTLVDLLPGSVMVRNGELITI